MKRALSSGGRDVVAGLLFRLVSVGAEVGVSIGLPHDEQNRLPSGTSLEHDGQRVIIPSRPELPFYAQWVRFLLAAEAVGVLGGTTSDPL